jgi:hypothetical protein
MVLCREAGGAAAFGFEQRGGETSLNATATELLPGTRRTLVASSPRRRDVTSTG